MGRPLLNILRQAHIYLPNENRPAILVPVYHASGWIVEQSNLTLLSEWRDPVPLAKGVRSVLQQFAVKEMQIRGGGSARESSTFRASGCRTLRDFELTYLCITVRAQGASELHFDAFARPHYENDIELRATLNPCGLDVEIGRKLLRLFDACEKWSDHIA
jgi:hypothetical protein